MELEGLLLESVLPPPTAQGAESRVLSGRQEKQRTVGSVRLLEQGRRRQEDDGGAGVMHACMRRHEHVRCPLGMVRHPPSAFELRA